MKVAVLLPVYHPTQAVFELIRAFKTQTRAPEEILIAETEPSDETRRTVAALGCNYIPIEAGKFDHAGTRSLLARTTDADVLVFFTQDVALDRRDAIEQLIEPLKSHVDAAYGRHVPGPAAHPFVAHKRAFLYGLTSREWTFDDRDKLGFDALAFSNVFAAYRRDALASIGFFGEKRLVCEDIAAAAAILKNGGRLAYVADAIVTHPQAHSLAEELRRYFDIGAAHAMDRDLLGAFGTPRRKGWRFVQSGLRHLRSEGHVFLIPQFLLWCSLRLIAYRLGNQNRFLPRQLAASLSGLPLWWRPRDQD